jgi:hypothetical protein
MRVYQGREGDASTKREGEMEERDLTETTQR